MPLNSSFLFKITLLIFSALLASCAEDSSTSTGTTTHIQGVLPIETGPSSARVASDDGRGFVESRNLTLSSTLSVAVLQAEADLLRDEGAVITTKPDPSGSFSFTIAPESGDYVMIVYDESLGVGVEQLIGFIELPIDADEAAAGWELNLTEDGAILELGELYQDAGGSLLPSEASLNSLYEVLNIETTELLLKAQRDNYLKVAQNDFLNSHLGIDVDFSYSFHSLNSVNTNLNKWVEPEDVVSGWNRAYNIAIDPIGEPEDDIDALIVELYRGNPAVTLTPPAEVEHNDGRMWGPLASMEYTDFGDPALSPVENAGGGFGQELLGIPPENIWYISVGANQGAYDFNITSPIDANGHFVYFTPILRVNTIPSSNTIESFQIRWAYWDSGIDAYSLIQEDTADVPLISDFQIAAAGKDAVSGEEIFPSLERGADGKYSLDHVFTTDGSGSTDFLVAVDISYRIGDILIFFTVWM